MDFKKCPRCGNFYHSELEVCEKCTTNENLDIQKLRNYFSENVNGEYGTVQEISVQTGINSRNLNRYLIGEEFAEKVNPTYIGNEYQGNENAGNGYPENGYQGNENAGNGYPGNGYQGNENAKNGYQGNNIEN